MSFYEWPIPASTQSGVAHDKSCRHGWCAPMSAAPRDVKLEPPARYDHPYDGPVVERVMPVAKARELCTSEGALRRAVACSWVSDGTCYMVLPSDEQRPYRLTADTKPPIAMVGRRTILTDKQHLPLTALGGGAVSVD